MSDASAGLSDRDATLAALDSSRDAFLSAFAEAPDEALGYLPEGDEYVLGVLPIHLQDPMQRYTALLEEIARADFDLVDRAADPNAAEQARQLHAALVAARPAAADRPRLLSDLQGDHQRARLQLASFEGDAFTRQAPVIFEAGAAPYPTSAQDVAGWLIAHYDEHTAQVKAMLAGWRERQGS
jgi:hypothetical protein